MEKYNEFIDDFENYLYAIKNLSSKYITNIIQTVKQFLNFINNFKFNNIFKSIEDISLNEIRTLSNQDIYSYIFYLVDNKYKQSTRVTKVEYLRIFFTFLYKIKHRLFKQPFQKINIEKKGAKQLPNCLSYKEAQMMTNLYKNSTDKAKIRNNAIIHLCLHCGLRIAEIANLNISDINLAEKKFLILGKGNKERTGYMNDDVYTALVKYLDIRKSIKPKNKRDNDKLFITKKLTKINVRTIRKDIKQAYLEAGINNNTYSVHTLRHTCATLMFRSGTDIRVIQEILGHSTIEITKIYTHLYDKDVEQALFNHPLSQFKINDAMAYTMV